MNNKRTNNEQINIYELPLKTALKMLRESKQYSQEEMAKIMGIARETYCKMEGGKYPHKKSKKLRNALNMVFNTDYFSSPCDKD
jgi:DNA-binding XRE family transcriptional regulator